MITIHNISKTYHGDVQALRGLELEIGAGMFGLVGPNGAGKTTLMRILAGLVTPSAGTAIIFGHDVTTAEGKQAVKSLLGYLPQELGLYPELSGREFLDYVGRLKGISDARARRQQIDELLVLVRLEEAANRRLKTYSGGMKRRIGIAQALLGDPRLLIVDEPTAGLDPEERVRLRNLLGEMSRRCAVILSTHIIEDINLSCSALAVLNKGKLLYHGAPRDLIAQARGKVWNILTDGEQTDSGLVIVSTQHMAEGLQYRVIGEPAQDYRASLVEPSLEDSYLWLMQHTSP
ncbi:MAG: ABC transporter ATP-binding protein [Anaerolineales bacterium]|nr:ABC transporter ATP-binding protein [Anaerolineales bacterium]